MSSSSDSDVPLTAAELLRRAAGNSKASPATQKPEAPPAVEADDIDDEIRRLEAELEGSSSSSSSDDDSDGEDNESSGNKGSGPTVLSLSAMKDDRIEALPANYLPSNKKRTMKIDRTSEQKEPPSKKLKVSSGLEVAVREVLAGYVARSSEKIPFYCRHCAKQYANEPEFKEHREGDFHKKAVEIERKATYCKLCRKQLTSPAQMKEHLTSRPHKQHLDKVRSNQRQAAQARGGGRGGNSQRRQWF
jgi:hypothetical protein